ncbi:Obp99c.2 family protein [Megaselia abdita]
MKYLIIACAVIAAVSAQEWKVHTDDELLNVRKVCIEKTKLGAEDVEKLKTFTYTETMKPYLGCFARETGIWEEATGFNIDRAVQQYKFDLAEDKVREILTKCINDNKKEGAKAFDYIVPVQQCLETSEIGAKLKAALSKKQ